MTPTALNVALVVADGGLALLALGAIAYVRSQERANAARPAGPAYLVAGAVIVGWLALVLVLAGEGTFQTTPRSTFPPLIGFGIFAPIVLGCALYALVPGFRERVARIPLVWLVGVQFLRVAGGLFLIGYALDELPGEFALPAGIGDVLVGIAAPFVAYRLATRGIERARGAVLAWCALGILDLVVAVTCGFLTAPSTFQQLALADPNQAITSYPFVLIPVFAVPLAVLAHIYVVARARTAHAAPTARIQRAQAA
ncbi:MAG: hypothetical protein QOJ89_5123 [bacterium]